MKYGQGQHPNSHGNNTKRFSPNEARLRKKVQSSQWCRLKRFGIRPEQFDFMLQQQQWRCAICRQLISLNAHVDHDHATNRVRGLLCPSCNTLLGFARDSRKLLRHAISYLKQHGN